MALLDAACWKRAARWYLAEAQRIAKRTRWSYRLFLLARGRGTFRRNRRPEAPWHNAVLQTVEEKNAAVRQVTSLGLPAMSDLAKNWDSLAALDCILRNTTPRAAVLDAGAELYSVILPWLFLYGYHDLHGINLVFENEIRRGPIAYSHGDITRTSYSPDTFDAITCLSVIEHGVPLDPYFKEMVRILKPGGLLITSTDYWETAIDTRGKRKYSVPIHIFSKDEILEALRVARDAGLRQIGSLTLACREKVVRWNAVDLDYTFVVFTLQKSS